MPLINSLNQTDFRTLKFSTYTETPPAVIIPIPDSNGELSPTTSIAGYNIQDLPPFGGRGGNVADYFRGGSGLPKSIAADTWRIGNFFVKNNTQPTTQGTLFVAKQNQLSLASVRTQATNPNEPVNDGIYTPVNTLLSVAGIAEGVYLPKQLRLRKYSQLIANSDEDNYTISGNDTNRLVQLVATKIGKGDVANTSKRNTISRNENAILGYVGGPGSALGVGRTRLYFAGYDLKSGRTNTYNPKTDQTGTLTLTSQEILAASSSLMSSTIGKYDINPKVYDFRKTLRTKLSGSSNIISVAPDYDTYNRENNFNLGDPGNPIYNRYNPNNGIDYSESTNIKALDKITAFPMYKAEKAGNGSATIPLKDIVKFRIAAIDNDKPTKKVFMHFRAFINSFNDTYSPDWSAVKYVGRGDSLYRYGGFTRTMQLEFNIVAQSRQELNPMYDKLNYLASNTMPDYSTGGYMRAPLIELTIGDYLIDHPGFISSLSFTPEFEAGFDINVNAKTTRELPKMMKITMGFTPIPEFIPQKIQGTFGETSDKAYVKLGEATAIDTTAEGYLNKQEYNYFGRKLKYSIASPPEPGDTETGDNTTSTEDNTESNE